MARNQHHEELTRLLDGELTEKLTPEEREKIFSLCVSAMHNARISAEKKLPPQPDGYPVDGPPNEEWQLLPLSVALLTPVVAVLLTLVIVWVIIK